MSKDVMLFDFQDQPVRVVDADGEPLFVAADVARVLSYRMASDMTRIVDDDERGKQMVRTPGGDQEMTVLTEAGLYRVVMARQAGYVDDTEARAGVKRFQRWVTHDVLPSIHRTGTYTAAAVPQGPPATDVALMSPEAILALAQRLVDTTERAEHAEARAQASQRVVQAIEAADGITLTQFHKHYFSDVTERTFFEFLYARGLLINQRGARGRGLDGRLRDGKEHRHPTAKGKWYLYLHGALDREGVRREHVRVRPGAPEVELVRALYHRGLTPNENAVAVIEGRRGLAVVS